MEFYKKGKENSISEVVERNTGMPINKFLDDSHTPYIHNLKETADMIRSYLKNHINPDVIIMGDYDADGDTSTAIMYWTFRAMGITPKLRIPRRFSEGYGMSPKIISELPDKDGLIITVDNGISSYEAISLAKKKGYTVIVTDHHLPPKDVNGDMILPPADIILDPHIYPEESEFEDYCGAGLAYRLSKELLPNTNLVQLLVLASIGTVSDVMPLVGANRALVKTGLKAINEKKCVPGLNAILEKLKMDRINEDDYGFTLGPIFNAAGRLYDDGAMRVVNLLTAGASAQNMVQEAEKLIEINNVRKGLVREGTRIAESQINGEFPVVLYNEAFHEGIIGIIAGHICEKYKWPVIVFTKTEDENILKGSGRSCNIHLKNTLDKMQELMVGYGGHAGAAGLSVRKEDLPEFTKRFRQLCCEIPAEETEQTYDLDVDDSYYNITEELKKYAPYGEGNPKIVFRAVFDVTNGKYKAIGDGTHFRIALPSVTLMGFGLRERYEAEGSPSRIECIGYISENWFNNNVTYNFEIKDFCRA